MSEASPSRSGCSATGVTRSEPPRQSACDVTRREGRRGGPLIRRWAVRDVRDISVWRFAFVPLAIQRCEPFLAEAGIPQPIARSPQAARKIARRFLRDTPTSLGAAEARQLLAGTCDALAAHYGEKASRGLYSWARRHETDRRQWLRWRIFGDILPPLAGVGGGTTMPPPAWVPQSTFETFREVIKIHLGSDAARDLPNRVWAAEALPPSRTEQALLAYDKDAIDPGDDPGIDDLTVVENMARTEAMVRAWTALRRRTSSEERKILLRWARLEAPRFNVTAEAIAVLKA